MSNIQPDDEEVYGYAVHCEFRNEAGGHVARTFRSKGKSKTKAERVPIFKRGFVRVVELEPYTRLQWLRVFGDGRRM